MDFAVDRCTADEGLLPNNHGSPVSRATVSLAAEGGRGHGLGSFGDWVHSG